MEGTKAAKCHGMPLRTALMLCFLLLVLTLPIRASLLIGAQPMDVEVSLAPGETRVGEIEVYNGGESEVVFGSSIADWDIDESGEFSILQPTGQPWSAVPLLKVSPSAFVVQPKSAIKIRYSATMPESPGNTGEYRGMIVFRSKPLPQKGSSIAVAGRLGIKAFIRVSGSEAPKCRLTEVKPAELNGAPYLRAVLQNTGNVSLRASGTLTLTARDGRVLASEPLNESKSLLLPGRDAVYLVPVASTPPGEYEVTAVVDYGGQAKAGFRSKVVIE